MWGLVDVMAKGTEVIPACSELTSTREMSSELLAQMRSTEPVRKASTTRREILARETQTKVRSFFPSNKKAQGGWLSVLVQLFTNVKTYILTNLLAFSSGSQNDCCSSSHRPLYLGRKGRECEHRPRCSL